MTITNPRIEKQKAEIGRTKAKITELQSKLREQEKALRTLEDMEIVAKFRNELMNDERLDLIKPQAKERPRKLPEPPADIIEADDITKEETLYANTENQ